MTGIVFDTLVYAEKLEASGFTPQQAKGQAHALRGMFDNQIATKNDLALIRNDVTLIKNDLTLIKSDLAVTKSDLALTKDDLAFIRNDLTLLDANVTARLAQTKSELIKWNVGTMLAMSALIVGLIKLV